MRRISFCTHVHFPIQHSHTVSDEISVCTDSHINTGSPSGTIEPIRNDAHKKVSHNSTKHPRDRKRATGITLNIDEMMLVKFDSLKLHNSILTSDCEHVWAAIDKVWVNFCMASRQNNWEFLFINKFQVQNSSTDIFSKGLLLLHSTQTSFHSQVDSKRRRFDSWSQTKIFSKSDLANIVS